MHGCNQQDWSSMAAQLLSALAGEVEDRGCPTWFRFFDDPAFDPGLRIEAASGPDLLLGWTAPEECAAVGVVATGWARAFLQGAPEQGRGQEGELSGALGVPVRVRLACVVSRIGRVGWRMEIPSADDVCTQPPAGGRVLDVLRRCFCLPTPPPPSPPAILHRAAWLLSVLDESARARRRLTWRDVERLHPLARVLAGSSPDPARDRLGGLLHAGAAGWTWEELHARAAAGELAGLVPAGLACWMDTGMLARWVLADVPPEAQLLALASGYLAESARCRLLAALEG